jgi:hypothetical protein
MSFIVNAACILYHLFLDVMTDSPLTATAASIACFDLDERPVGTNFNTCPNLTEVPDDNVFEEANSRWNVHPDIQPTAWLDPIGDIPDEDMSDSHDALTNMDMLGNGLRKVSMNLLCLEWGGECICNPCPSVYGFVKDIYVDGVDGELCFEVDFGAYMGIQHIVARIANHGSLPK